jgi:hypothetical protein
MAPSPRKEIINNFLNPKTQQGETFDKTNSNAAEDKLKAIRGKPFWIENPVVHEQTYYSQLGQCCFNHIIGLPVKDGDAKPIFDYEIELFKHLEHGRTNEPYKHLWIKKARGLGITEILLRYMGWRALVSNEFHGERFIVVTGPKERIALDLIRRVKHLFEDYMTQVPLKDSVVLNGVTIEAFPSHTVAMRGYEDFKFILLDEADYFRPQEQEELLPAVRGFIAKTHPYIIMVSTPRQPNSLFHRIEQFPSDEEAGFIRLQYLYQRGLGKIYKEADIEEEKRHDYFKKEYEGQYAFGVGNLFTEESILACEARGRDLDARLALAGSHSEYRILPTRKSLGIDIGWGSSWTAFVLTEHVDGLIRVVYCKQFERADHKAMVNHAYSLIRVHALDNGTNKVYVDGSFPSFIRDLKETVGEAKDYLPLLDKLRKSKTDPRYAMNIIPVNFSEKQQAMLDHTKEIVDRGAVAINPDTPGNIDLLTDLRIAQNKPDSLKIDKTDNRMDLFDAFRLALEYYK